MRWFSKFVGHRDSEGLLNDDFSKVWVCSPWYGADMDDDFAAFCGGGDPWPNEHYEARHESQDQ